ncbi:hypothetical protein YDYSY3_39580 [Paenibacillus chitinolyticus]|uniref:hypothetical protein n=1 Tax=Paenibacillus chitinolyticus TaxID=79263 RepID=UPI0026E4C51E|nr:hypothetical protein [Paenibacillus chitinolyticus]GKS12958.1 hypothetical protein YDYSY3_39580 [Paenibacillus chitinolyticus]
MNRIFLATHDQDESEWLSDELKEFGKVVRVVDSLDFFVPQWENVEANIIIFMESIVHSESSFLKLLQRIKTDKPSTILMLIYHRDRDEFVNDLIIDGIICVSYMELEPGIIESSLIMNSPTSTPLPMSKSIEVDKPLQQTYQQEVTSIVEDEVVETPTLYDSISEHTELSNEVNDNETSELNLSNTNKEISHQISTKLFASINHKKNLLQEQLKKSTLIENVKPEELDFEPLINRSKKKIKQRFVGTAVIAITGAEPCVGTTHSAIMIANYLARQDYSVALVEANASNDFIEIEAAYEGISDSKHIKTPAFNINGVRYIKNVKELNMVNLLTANYSYIILDLGCYADTEWYEEFLRAGITIVVGSGSEWKQKNILRFFRDQIHHDQSRWKLCVPFADKQTIQDIKSKLPKCKIYGLPFHPDPFLESKSANDVMENILKLNQHQKLTLLKKKMQEIFS